MDIQHVGVNRVLTRQHAFPLQNTLIEKVASGRKPGCAGSTTERIRHPLARTLSPHPWSVVRLSSAQSTPFAAVAQAQRVSGRVEPAAWRCCLLLCLEVRALGASGCCLVMLPRLARASVSTLASTYADQRLTTGTFSAILGHWLCLCDMQTRWSLRTCTQRSDVTSVTTACLTMFQLGFSKLWLQRAFLLTPHSI